MEEIVQESVTLKSATRWALGQLGRYGTSLIVTGVVVHYVQPEKIHQKAAVAIATTALTAPLAQFVQKQTHQSFDTTIEALGKLFNQVS